MDKAHDRYLFLRAAPNRDFQLRFRAKVGVGARYHRPNPRSERRLSGELVLDQTSGWPSPSTSCGEPPPSDPSWTPPPPSPGRTPASIGTSSSSRPRPSSGRSSRSRARAGVVPAPSTCSLPDEVPQSCSPRAPASYPRRARRAPMFSNTCPQGAPREHQSFGSQASAHILAD